MEASSLSKEEMMNMELFLIQEWEAKLNEDGIFDTDNVESWVIEPDNAEEFIEALQID